MTALRVVEIVRRMEQGRTQPFLVRTEDDALYVWPRVVRRRGRGCVPSGCVRTWAGRWTCPFLRSRCWTCHPRCLACWARGLFDDWVHGEQTQQRLRAVLPAFDGALASLPEAWHWVDPEQTVQVGIDWNARRSRLAQRLETLVGGPS